MVVFLCHLVLIYLNPTREDKFGSFCHRVSCSSQLQGRDSSNFNLFASVNSAGFSKFLQSEMLY